MAPDEFIWVNRWDEFQTFQRKRGKPWAPPWIKTYLAQLSDDRYLELTDRQRALLHDIRMIFAMTRGRLRRDSPTIARYRHRQTRDEDLETLNHAGFISFCSGTVLEQRRNAFWNSSALEVDKTIEVEEPSSKDLLAKDFALDVARETDETNGTTDLEKAERLRAELAASFGTLR